MSDAQRKRVREEEEEVANANNCQSFGEHRNKRVQCLPLRTSPRVSQQGLPSSNMTPQNSDPEEPLPGLWPWASSMHVSAQPSHDTEMDLVDSASPLPQQHTHAHPPNIANPHSDTANGRMPTPIQPSFAAQVRGQQCEWAGPGPAVKVLNGVVNLGHHQTGFSDTQCVPRTMASSNAWQDVQNNRRLPSPISEGDDSMANSTFVDSGDSGMTMDTHVPDQQFECFAPQPSPPHAMEHPNAMIDIDSQTPSQAVDGEEDPTTPSPSRRSHIRNYHTINNWTWQPGMKKSFSIGYRSDCEKCRLKVPGHFNHIIIS
ncbi:hypothetical protein BGZ63DRAFT_350626 [Mariannaea sp. PMI_226]|nr:hypothetical protein BGZ63DRAFT_350626 [Mariannaea sp. PMI_226]